jgi:hypothetical protein
MNATQLLERFVECFHRLEGMDLSRNETFSGDIEPLLVAPWDQWGGAEWRPRRVETPAAAMEAFHRTVGGPLPPLYDELVRTYAWSTVDLRTFTLVANLPPVPASLEREITSDAVLFRILSAGGSCNSAADRSMTTIPSASIPRAEMRTETAGS